MHFLLLNINYNFDFFFKESTNNVKIKWIEADFSRGFATFEHIKNELAGIPVGVLGK